VWHLQTLKIVRKFFVTLKLQLVVNMLEEIIIFTHIRNLCNAERLQVSIRSTFSNGQFLFVFMQLCTRICDKRLNCRTLHTRHSVSWWLAVN